MKRCLKTLLLIILLIPTFVMAKDECDTDKVSITDLVQVKIEGKMVEEKDPELSLKTIRFNLRFYEVGDSITYSFKVKNESDNEFILNKKDFEIDSDYLTYELTSDNDDLIVDANSTRTFQLRISYTDEVPATAFDNHEFNSSNSFKINLSNDRLGSNPNTGTIPTIIIISLVLSIILVLSLLNMKKLAYYVLLLGFILSIPTCVKALCTLNIEIENKYVISNRPLFCVTVDNDKTYYYEYEEGMNFTSYINSDLNNNTFKLNEKVPDSSFIIYSNHEEYGNCNGFKYSSGNFVEKTETIKNLDCYSYSTEYANIM